MKLSGNVVRITAKDRLNRQLPVIEEESDENSNLSSGASLDHSAPFAAVVPGCHQRYIHQATRSAVEKNIIKMAANKQKEIFAHYKNSAGLEPLKNEKKTAVDKRLQLNSNYKEEKNKLNDIRKKRCAAEKMFDRQVFITNLDNKKGVFVKARLIFARRLDEVDKLLVDMRRAINKDVAKTEKNLLERNNEITENESFIHATQNEIVALEKSLKSDAANLYNQVLRIERENKKLSRQSPIFTEATIKNGKYLLMPLLKAGKFRSFGAQLAYQARRIKKQDSESNRPTSETQVTFHYQRIEI
ncbi:MAG: hypothetical protein ACI802_002049 [Candidatus Paceibacteria bacterium]|jgi:hypothetical protein